MTEVQAETRKVKIDKEFIVKIKGEVETDMTDEKIKWCLNTMDEELEDIIREEIIEDTKISVKAIVRCKDCKYFQTAKVNSKGFLICPASGMEITETDYCSYGERKERQ